MNKNMTEWNARAKRAREICEQCDDDMDLYQVIIFLQTKLETTEAALSVAIIAKQNAESQASLAHQKTYKEVLLGKNTEISTKDLIKFLREEAITMELAECDDTFMVIQAASRLEKLALLCEKLENE